MEGPRTGGVLCIPEAILTHPSPTWTCSHIRQRTGGAFHASSPKHCADLDQIYSFTDNRCPHAVEHLRYSTSHLADTNSNIIKDTLTTLALFYT